VLTTTQTLSADSDRAQRGHRLSLQFMLVWTALVIAALWWLHRVNQQPEGSAAWIYHSGEISQQTIAERVRDWFRLAHLNFQRIYPWVLLGPYVAWLASFFPFERGRLRQSVPFHLLACGAFAAASYVITSHSSVTIARVVIFTSNRQVDGPLGHATNKVRVEITKPGTGTIIREERTVSHSRQGQPEVSLPDILTFNNPDFSDPNFTNLIQKVEHALKPPKSPPELPTMRPLTTLLDLLAYGAIVGLAHSVHFYRRYRERERQALQLESNLAKARLGALQAQLQPHFLFNSLNAIVTLVRRDPRAAESTLTSLSELLRLTLSRSDTQEVTLREELHFVQRYLDIQQTRFGDRLRFEQNIQPATLDGLVPTLLLQPLVENAIRHGIEPSEHAGLVRLTTWHDNDRLILTLEDNGAGIAPACGVPLKRKDCTGTIAPEPSPVSSSGTGIGLANLRARLDALYGTEQKLECGSPPEGGFAVRLEIPFRLASRAVATGSSPLS